MSVLCEIKGIGVIDKLEKLGSQSCINKKI